MARAKRRNRPNLWIQIDGQEMWMYMEECDLYVNCVFVTVQILNFCDELTL